MDAPLAPTQWNVWYRLARKTLGYRHQEAAEYANLRFVEEQNRATLHRARAVSGQRPQRTDQRQGV